MTFTHGWMRRGTVGVALALSLVTLLTAFPDADAATERKNESRRDTWLLPFSSRAPLGDLFRRPETAYTAGHRGMDFAVSSGTDVRAPESGVVHFSGVVAEKPVITVRIDGDTLYTFEPVISELQVGDAVTKGMHLGVSDVGGHCQDSCTHLGVRVRGDYVNPLRFFGGRPVLLPLDTGT